MRLSEFTARPLSRLKRISPSKYLSLQQCSLKEIWGSSEQSLLPRNPAAYIGTIIHRMLEMTFHGKILNRDELSDAWDDEIRRQEKKMLSNSLEKHFVPLKMSVFNFEVKKLLAFKMICSHFNDTPRKKSDSSKSSAEEWVQTSNGKVAGKIDLVKKSESGTEIIDYKTGPLADASSPSNVKEEYQVQVNMYAALYHATHGEWPVSVTLVGINQNSVTIEVEPEECAALLQKAEKSLDDINELINTGLKPEEFAQPSPEACKYCLFRPACSEYWNSRQENGNWPTDVRGRITDKTMLENGLLRIVIATEQGEIAIRGLSPDRHPFLITDIESVLFCDLSNENLEGYFVENLFTTGYALNK